jgi:hypothetical protein
MGYAIICLRGFDIYGEITLLRSEKARVRNYAWIRRVLLGYDEWQTHHRHQAYIHSEQSGKPPMSSLSTANIGLPR